MAAPEVSIARVAEGVSAFNRVYAEMDEALWRISRGARHQLVERRSHEVVQALVWTIRSWWGVQGARREVAGMAAEVLSSDAWTDELFASTLRTDASAEAFARDRVCRLVEGMLKLGAGRQEFSLASKTLHWLMPWRVPVYDSLVRKSVGVPSTWSHQDAYRAIVSWQSRTARALAADGLERMGEVEPRSPFRALDKYLWWIGGGDSGRAVLVKDPWKSVYRLGLRRD